MGEKKFNWKAYQKFMGYSDEEMRTFREDPRKAEGAPSSFHER
jgi:hypothetical protein